MLSSKSDSKYEGRFVARIDVLTERVDSLASTVATTASAIAKKDGEIASLRRELQLRDEQLQALAGRAQGPAGADPRELQELRQTVAALANEHGKRSGGSSKQFDELVAKVGLLTQRIETVSATVSTTAAGMAGRDGELAAIRKRLEQPAGPVAGAPADPELKRQLDELGAETVRTRMRVEGHATELQAVKAQLADQPAQAYELREMLTTLRSRVEALASLRVGVTEEELEERLAETRSALADSAHSVEALTRQVKGSSTRIEAVAEALRATEAGVTEQQLEERLAETRSALADSAHKVEALTRQVKDSSTRIEAVAEALRATEAGVTEQQLEERLAETRSALADSAHKVEALTQVVTESSSRIEAVAEALRGTEAGVTEQQLEERLAETRAALEALPERIDELASRLGSGTTRLADAEQRLRALDRRAEESSTRFESIVDERSAETSEALTALLERIDELATGVDSGTTRLADAEQRLRALDRQAEESTRIEAIVEARSAETSEALVALGKRVDELATGVDSATTSHADEEQKLEELHHQVSESSSRIASIADDLREALGAFPEATPDQLGELSTRIELVEKRVATVAAEVARAKTLWPVALRSLEARLDDVAPKRAYDEPETDAGAPSGEDAREDDEPERTTDDFLAGLRESLQAMENVAAEHDRTTETPGQAAPEAPTPHEAAVGGARIVPLRGSDP